MGKIITKTHFTKEQKLFLAAIIRDPYIRNTFYLTGGTALSACYLNHRLSEDVDLFTRKKFDPQQITTLMSRIAAELNSRAALTPFEGRLRYDLTFPNSSLLKVDFVTYGFDQIEDPNTWNGLRIDSIGDILR